MILKNKRGRTNRLCVLHQFTWVDEKPKSPMSSLLKKWTGKQGKQNKTRDRNLRNFSVSSDEMCLQHFLCLLLVYSSLRQKWSSTFACEEHRGCYRGDGMAEENQARGPPPPPALFHQISWVISILLSQTPPPVSQLAVYSAFSWRQHMSNFSMFGLEHPLNVRPGHRAHRGKDFQMQRQDRKQEPETWGSISPPPWRNQPALWRRQLKQLGNAYSWCSTPDPVKRCKYLDFNFTSYDKYKISISFFFFFKGNIKIGKPPT